MWSPFGSASSAWSTRPMIGSRNLVGVAVSTAVTIGVGSGVAVADGLGGVGELGLAEVLGLADCPMVGAGLDWSPPSAGEIRNPPAITAMMNIGTDFALLTRSLHSGRR